MCDSLPLQLPAMTLNNIEIKRENSVKFLGVIIDENLTWKNHIEVEENKISKNIRVLYRASCNSFKQRDINILDEFAWNVDILTQQEIAKGKPYICQSNYLNITINHC